MAKASGTLSGRQGHSDGGLSDLDEQGDGNPSKWIDSSRSFQTGLDVSSPLGPCKSLMCLQKLNDLLNSI